MTERVRQAELARRLGVTKQAIGQLVDRGVVVVGPDGLIDEDRARAAIAASVHPAGKSAQAARGSAPVAPEYDPAMGHGDEDWQQARARRESIEADRAALKLRRETAEVASAALLERQLRSAVLEAREFLLSEPARLAVLLDGCDRAGREALLRESFQEFLRRLASWREQQVEDDADDA